MPTNTFLEPTPFQAPRLLPSGNIHLWWWQSPAAPSSDWEAWLSPAEQQALLGWRTPARRQEYLAGHAFLRWVLAQYLNCCPAAVPLSFPQGAGPRLPAPWRCSLTHSYGHFACAVGQV
ncbi:MAG: hypothetical protein D6722_23480, partial [Bacteroidetes bacterium]